MVRVYLPILGTRYNRVLTPSLGLVLQMMRPQSKASIFSFNKQLLVLMQLFYERLSDNLYQLFLQTVQPYYRF